MYAKSQVQKKKKTTVLFVDVVDIRQILQVQINRQIQKEIKKQMLFWNIGFQEGDLV